MRDNFRYLYIFLGDDPLVFSSTMAPPDNLNWSCHWALCRMIRHYIPISEAYSSSVKECCLPADGEYELLSSSRSSWLLIRPEKSSEYTRLYNVNISKFYFLNYFCYKWKERSISVLYKLWGTLSSIINT